MSKNDNKITFQQGIDWTTNWRNGRGNRNVDAFLIPAEDLVAALIEIGVLPNGTYATDDKNIRAYLGVDDKNTDRLVIVGTKKDTSVTPAVYRDMITDDQTGRKWEGGGSLYDFTEPCPTACDVNSPLN
ncbi:hypothetical protein ACFQ1M_05620 [Sungkyunkwania multivorans]|uniref:Uncharacterized protein n=1 Tax=Sungkyunkwania multivorans TaxID=1173618 RepID=A0ABW3CWY2_9FLAO